MKDPQDVDSHRASSAADGAPRGDPDQPVGELRERIWRIIFLSDTAAGKAFDIALLVVIGLSVVVLMLESVEPLRQSYGRWFGILEWAFTIVFTLEYATRLAVCARP